MNPWFLTEGDVIPFTKKDDKVVKLPNVGAYPNFLTGVDDLRSRVKQGTLSDEMYKKLYTELLHRFMRRESAETPWFMAEAPNMGGIMSLPQAQQIKALSQQVANLPSDVSDRIIDKIASALELAQQKDTKGKQMTPFKQTAVALKNIEDSDMKKYYKEVARYMLGNSLTSKEITTIISEINNDTCVRMEELKKPSNVLSNIIPTSELSLETSKYYRSLFGATEYGVGPGELLFSTHSKSLRKEGKGDLKVIGDASVQEIEVKAKRRQPARFVDRATFPSGEYMTMANEFIKKYKKVIPMSASGASFTHIHDGVTANPKIKNQVMAEVKPIINSLFNNTKVTENIMKLLFAPTLDLNQLKSYYAQAVIKRYFDAKAGGMGILFCRLTGKDVETNYAADYQSFASFAKIDVKNTTQPYLITNNQSYPFPQTDIELQ
jgi:hypothetical protein